MQEIVPAYKSSVDKELTQAESTQPTTPAEDEYDPYGEDDGDGFLALLAELEAERGGPASRPTRREPEKPKEPEIKYIKIDPNTRSRPEQQAIISSMENQAAISELHRTGLVLENLVAQKFPDTEPFGFKTTPPWELDQSVKKAVEWLKENQSAFPPSVTTTTTETTETPESTDSAS